jgi:hypothetical protein
MVKRQPGSSGDGVAAEDEQHRAKRARQIDRVLARHSPQARLELQFTTPLELAVATILRSVRRCPRQPRHPGGVRAISQCRRLCTG